MPKIAFNKERWRRVEEVYHEALEHRPESRAAFVIATYGGDSSLRREVESAVVFSAQSYGEIYAYRIADGMLIRLTHNKWEEGVSSWEAPLK
ncbi:MAG TPA: hypothetical protein VKB88_37620 [Bryobacteraceae bacterium]|nr:hypothetical protein [Bryobacteraceae bacterium]